tara:strand:- start:680 stop:1384 length:705 start_codon:yes stop_codon:yes gene_type:complete
MSKENKINFLTDEQRSIIDVPTPVEMLSENPKQPFLTSVKAYYVIEILNLAFGEFGWLFDSSAEEKGSASVVVKGTLKIRLDNDKEHIITQYGGHDSKIRGDAYKGACTDALKKCASYLGICADVFRGDVKPNGVYKTKPKPEGMPIQPPSNKKPVEKYTNDESHFSNQKVPFKTGENVGKTYIELDDDSLGWILKTFDKGSLHFDLAVQESNRRKTDDSEVNQPNDALDSIPA